MYRWSFVSFITIALLLPNTAFAYLSLIRQGAESADVPNANDRLGTTVCVGDFNGDGLDDLASAAPDESNGLINSAVHGLVVINYGTARGLGHLGADAIHVGDLGTAAARFGRSMASADFDQDGYDDLAVGIPQLDNLGGPDRGAVWIYEGGPGGLQLAPYRQIYYDDIEVAPEDYANFGWALTTGDFDDDTYPDLAASAIGHFSDTGVLYFFYGSMANGITTTGFDKLFPLTVGGMEAPGSHFGWSMVAGQFNGVGGDDIAVGAPSTDVQNQPDAGRVYFYYAGASGITGTGGWYLDQSNLGGVATAGNARLGFSLAAGHMFQVSGQEDVAVGAPQDDYGMQNDAGSVILVAFDSQPTTYDTLRKLRQHSIYDATDASPGDQFGYAVAVGRFDIGNYEDLAVGAPYEDVTEQFDLGEQFNAGTFHIVFGEPGGPSMTNSLTKNMIDLNNFVDAGENLGFSLAFGRFDASSREGLAIGAPNADYDSWDGALSINNAGQVHIFSPWRQPQGYPHRSSTAFDCDGFLVYAQRPFQRVRPASTTKTVTLALACDAIFDGDVDPNHFYTVPDWVADSVGGSQTPLEGGEQLSFVGLMQTMMTVSGNDSAMLIGAILSGDGGPWEGWEDTSPAFATMMETKLSQLGLSTATSMTNAAGIDAGDHYVTALDWGWMAYQTIQDDCVEIIVDKPQWIVERIKPAGTTLDWFAVPGDGGGPVHVFEGFSNGFVNSVTGKYDKTIGTKGGSTPGAWLTGVAAADPFGGGMSAAAGLGSRRDDVPVEGVENGDVWGLNAALLKVAETFCDDGMPDDILQPPNDPDPKPWGLLTSIPPCPDAGPHGLTFDLGEGQLVEPGRTVQLDLMRRTHIDPQIPVKEMVTRTSEVLIQPFTQVNVGVVPHQSNLGLRLSNIGATAATLEVFWGSSFQLIELAPGAKSTVPGIVAPGSNFLGTILSLGSQPVELEIVELGYQYDLVLGLGVALPDYHTVQLTRSGDIQSESVSTYVRGLDDDCGDDTLDLVARSDDGVPTAVGDPGGIRPPAPASFQLLQPFPNPFNPRTTVRFDLPRGGTVDLMVYDVRGQLVRTLQRDASFPPGRHDIEWNGQDDAGRSVSSGIYYIRLSSGHEQQTQRVALIK